MMTPAEANLKTVRGVWAIVLLPLLQILAGVLIVNVSTFILRNVAQGILSLLSVQNESVCAFVIFYVRMSTVYVAYSIFVHIFERRQVTELSLNRAAAGELVVGGLLAFGAIAFVTALLWMLGSITFYGVDPAAPLLQSIFYHVFFAFLQDIVFFAILFRILESRLGSWIAIAVASLIFGFVHLAYPGYTLWSVIAQAVEAGILFSALFILTRRIWLLLGFHAMWNIIQYGFLLGFESKGFAPFFRSELSGPALLTGMPVGLEASIFTFCIGTVLGIYVLRTAYNKRSFTTPYWKQK